MGRLSLQAIFCHSSPAYDRTHRVPAPQRKAARAIMQCRTAARGGPLKNWQLVGLDGQRVTFTYHAHLASSSGGSSTCRMTLPVEQCIARVLQHVVPVKTQGGRCYGLYHARKAAVLAPRRAELGQVPAVVCAPPSWQAGWARQGEGPPERCPVCGQ